MPQTQDRAVMNWLFIFAFTVAFLVVFGGFVRLTRSGLSIVEWNPISGSMPPMGEQAWQDEFAKYQLTPEYIKVNSNMTLDEYKYIFYMEWIHRNVARFAGLIYAFPVFYFLFTKKIPWKEFGIYFIMGILFISQALAGWVMVASGLVDRPSVSHFNLTLHLLLALSLFGLALWTALGHKFGFPDRKQKSDMVSAIEIGCCLSCVVGCPNHLWRIHSGVESRSCFKHMAADVRGTYSTQPVQLIYQFDRIAANDCVHPPLVCICRFARCAFGL